jgi:hypothetical protein
MGQFPLHNGIFFNDYYEANALDQWGKIMITEMRFAHTTGPGDTSIGI